jgi:hypothetical protein
MHLNDQEKTQFCTGEGLYQFTVMPFGFCNMQSILWDLTYEACLVYLDVVIVVTWTFWKQLNNLWKVCQSF